MAQDLVGRVFFLGPLTLLLVMDVKAAVSSITLKSIEVSGLLAPLVSLSVTASS